MQNNSPNDTPNDELTPNPINPVPPTEYSPFEGAPVAVQPPKKSKKKLIIIGSIIAGALVVLGGGSALAYNVWYQNPDKVVTDALVSAVTANTLQLPGTLEVTEDDYKVKASFGLNADAKNAELAVKLDYTADGQTVKVEGAGHFSTEGDLYVKVNNIKDVISSLSGDTSGGPTVFDDLSTKLEGKWVKITSDDIGEVSEEYEKTQQCVEDVTKQISENKSLQNEVTDLYKNNRFVVVGESLGSRTINGVGSLGYVVDLDTQKAKAFAAGLESTELGKKLKGCDDTINFKEFADSLEAKGATTGEGEDVLQLWTSRFGHEITEINASGKSDSTELKAVLHPVFNKEVTINTPSDAMTLESLQAEFEKATEAYYTEYYAELYS